MTIINKAVHILFTVLVLMVNNMKPLSIKSEKAKFKFGTKPHKAQYLPSKWVNSVSPLKAKTNIAKDNIKVL